MSTFKIYSILTIIITSYFFWNLYTKENQLFIFMIYMSKSKFHFTLLLNLLLMLSIGIGKILIKIFFGEVRLSEMMVTILY